MGREKISRSENVAFPDLITPTVRCLIFPSKRIPDSASNTESGIGGKVTTLHVVIVE